MIPDMVGTVTASAQDNLTQSRIQALEAVMKQGDLKKASREFEAYFISYLLKVMRETVPKSTLTQNRMGETFQSFYDEAIGKQAAEAGGIGLARLIETSLQYSQLSQVLDRETVEHPSKVLTDSNRKER